MNKSFTLIEILVVVSIIGVITAISTLSYIQFNKNARDAKRKTDLEQIRAALEMYRSNVGVYPTPKAADRGLPYGSSLTDATGTVYMQTVPDDPKPKGAGEGYTYECTLVDNKCQRYYLFTETEATYTKDKDGRSVSAVAYSPNGPDVAPTPKP